MTTDFEIFLDTNILVHSSLKDLDIDKNVDCQKVLKKMYEMELPIYISTQVLREYYGVVTAARYIEKPLAPGVAKEQVLNFVSEFNLLEIDQEVIEKLLELAEEHEIKGKQIHDATIAATMHCHEIPTLLTYNRKDFVNFSHIEIFSPAELMEKLEL